MTFPTKWVVTPQTQEQADIVMNWFNDLVERRTKYEGNFCYHTGEKYKYFYPNYTNKEVKIETEFENDPQFCYIHSIPGYTEIDFETFLIITELMRQGKIETRLQDLKKCKLKTIKLIII